MTDRFPRIANISARVLLSTVWLIAAAAQTAAQGERETIHRTAGAGTWFPDDAGALRGMVDGYLSKAPPVVAEPPVALIVPHAGYEYSGAVAGAAYSTLLGHSYRRVVVLGVSHRTAFRGATVLAADFYETPLGRIPVDVAARDALLESPLVSEIPDAHRAEHSLDNQLPMLQRALGEFELLGVLVGDLSPSERARLADALRQIIDDATLLVASSDFTHHGPYYGYTVFQGDVATQLRSLNDLAMQDIQQLDPGGWDSFVQRTGATICGRNAIGLLLATLEPRADVQASRIAYDTSGRITGDWSNSVTYAGVVFWRPTAGLTHGEQQTLLRLARNTLTSSFDSTAADEDEYESTPRLIAPGAAFVSLKTDGELRGCIGHMAAVEPLYMSVARNAVWASRDPRFELDPITREEVSGLSIEISVLTPLRRLYDPRTIVLGVDGLMIVRREYQGVLLPYVPVEEGWDREQFLAAACLKAGLPVDAWQDPATEIYRFSAHTFGDGGVTHDKR